ncbi:phage portal protein [Paenibacillus sp. P22]|uniref:phage portal protein n=1 Tax=Paenibacillus sp. P22 TaxID=483908 RepID=UPI0004350AE0|nr:phage portal protein [Paenibacillus sp. P22]CDN42078.1 Prophage portal protein, SPP1 family [Paenibacillus sp. P22]
MGKLFTTGAAYPPAADIQRIATYKRARTIFDGRQYEIYERAAELLKDTPHAAQLRTLYLAVNVVDILVTKPADLLVGEPPTYISGHPDDAIEQQRLASIVEENDMNTLIHEVVTGAGIRGDAFLKTYYAPRYDVSETVSAQFEAPEIANEPIIEAVDATIVFPELSRGSRKRFKAINIAYVEWVATEMRPGLEKYLTRKSERYVEVPFLVVERHIPGYITYERYRLEENGVDTSYGVPIPLFKIGEQAATGRDEDVVETGIPELLVHHIPYKTVDDRWNGIGGIEKLESVLAAINDRMTMIDYVLHRHGDPTAYGPELPTDADGGIRFGGKYIPTTKEDIAPGYMEWNSQLDGCFKELDILLGLVYQMSETPQWLFGTTLAEDKGGSGTSHSDGSAIQMRMMPILTKVKRIRNYVDRAVRDALWIAMKLENFANDGMDDFIAYDPIYPAINWKDGLPKDLKAEAEAYSIRTGGKATLDVESAIKRMDGITDDKVRDITAKIAEDEKATVGTVDASVFNA